jgi:hypothetical protein
MLQMVYLIHAHAFLRIVMQRIAVVFGVAFKSGHGRGDEI